MATLPLKPLSLLVLTGDYEGDDEEEISIKLTESLYPAKANIRDKSRTVINAIELIENASKVSSIDQIKAYLDSVNELIFKLCGNSNWGVDPRAVEDECYFLGNTVSRRKFGCKTDEEMYKEKKMNVMIILKDLIVYMFRCVERTNKELLKETNHFVVNLFTTIRSYCYFISYQTISSLYDTYIKMLVDEVNSIFEPVLGSELILKRCKNVYVKDGSVNGSSIKDYGCGREVYVAHQDKDNQRIVIVSMDDSGLGTEVKVENSESISGRKRKTRRHKMRHQRSRCRRTLRRK